MSVYVDPLFSWDAALVSELSVARLTRKHGQWSHMTADSEAELRAFAVRLGLKARWIQDAGTPDVHFDLVPPRRAKAVLLGAIELTRREAYEKRKEAWAHAKWLASMRPEERERYETIKAESLRAGRKLYSELLRDGHISIDKAVKIIQGESDLIPTDLAQSIARAIPGVYEERAASSESRTPCEG